MTTELIIPITTSPVAALLAAAGVAQWLSNTVRELNDGSPAAVQMRHAGHSFVISTQVSFTPEQAGQCYQPPLTKWILTAKNAPAPASLQIIDYEDEKRHNQEYRDRLERYRKQGINLRNLNEDERSELEQLAPRDFWPVAAFINQMSALSAYNKTIERWAACRSVYPELVALILTMCSGQPCAIEQAQHEWEALAKRHGLEKNPLLSATQVVNPEQGKGANRAKADKLDIGGQESFWLLEYFKYAGLFHAALPRMVQSLKDRKTYVVIPSHEGIATEWYERTFKDFQRELWASSSVKMDILAVLRYTDLMLREWEGAQRSSGRRRRPADYIEGLHVVSYKDLGSAYAVMNVAAINLPDWIAWPRNADHATQLRTTLENHVFLISALDEKKGEEERLLRNYREFLSSRDPRLSAFFAFTTGYAGHAMRRMSKRQRVRRLTLENIKEIIMANEPRRQREGLPPLGRIIENQGFRNIATAIRQSTTQLQFYNAERQENLYDVRYGLASDLERHSRNKQEFMQALGEFIMEYSQENARVMERMAKQGRKNYRKRIPISVEDIAQVTTLVDEYGAPTVASMLIACGYARDPRDPDAQTAAAADETPDLTQTDGQQDDEEMPF